MRMFLRDLGFAWRLLARSPAFAAISIVCLALGIGATTAVFTVVDAVVFRPLPYNEPERLVRIYTEFPAFPNGGLRRFVVSPPEFIEMRETLRSFERIDAWQTFGVNLATAQEPVRVTATLMSGTLFESLGITPQQGRWIDAEDDREGASGAIVISDGLWRRAFGGSADVLGREVKVNGSSAKIVGVMPAGFQYPPGQVDVSEVWAPLRLTAADRQNRGNHRLSVIAQLGKEVNLNQARQEIESTMKLWGERRSNNFHTIHPETHTLLAFGMQEEVVRAVKPAMQVILGAVGFVLLIACVNVANLLLARAETRQREIGVRVAMGAGTGGLIRQFIAEGLLISVAGAVLGLGLAMAGVRLLLWAGAESVPRLAEVSMDWRVLGFTGALLVATTLFFGMAPLAQALARNTHETLKAVTGRTSATLRAAALRRGLVVAELSLALVLLIACGLMLQAFWRLQAVNAGIDPANRLTARVTLPFNQYPDDAAFAFVSRLEESLSRIPGVVFATVMSGLPPQRAGDFNDTGIENFVRREGGPIQNVDYWQFTGNHFFETMGARLVEGRFLEERDSRDAPLAVVVNETMARTFWPGESAIGHRVRLSTNPDAPWRTIVGVAADMKNGGVDQPAGTELFVPWRQAGSLRGLQIAIRAVGDPLSLTGAVRTTIAQLDPALPVAAVRTMDEVIAQTQSRPRFLSILLTFFSAVAVTLASIGVYGVISYSVTRRTTEIGIRMAIGAGSGDVLWMVLAQGAVLGAVGIAIGLMAAVWLTRFLRGMLFAIEPLDMPTFAVTVTLLLVITLLASWIPARRATRIRPVAALRYD